MVYQKMKHATLLLLLLLVTIAAVFVLEHFASSWRNQNCNQPMEFQQRIPIRVINRPLFDYRPDIATRVERLVLANAMADEPEVVRLARDVIETPPKEAWSSPIKQSHMIIQTPQARKIDELTSNKRNGFFVECGAYDGERASNTVWLEQKRNWTGLLIEMDPYFYTQLLGKNRRVWSANICLSPVRRITTVPYEQSYTQLGRLLYDGTNPRTDVEDKPGLKRLTERQYVPCFPLESLLLAIGQTRIDYFSLDVEGLELDVLETIPWKQFDIRTISVEYKHVKRGKQAVIDYMTRQGYRLVADLRANQPGQSIFVEDFVFVRR